MPEARVLIVDSNGSAIRQARTTLEFEGLEVDEAFDRDGALEVVARARPSLVLIAVGLPGVNGYDLCREILAVEGLAGTQVVLTYTAMDVFDEARAARVGAAGQLSRPFLPSQLLDTITAVMGDGFLRGEGGTEIAEPLVGHAPRAFDDPGFLTSAESKFLDDSAEEDPRTLASDFVSRIDDVVTDSIGPDVGANAAPVVGATDPPPPGSEREEGSGPALVSYDPEDAEVTTSGSGPHFSGAKAVRAGAGRPPIPGVREMDLEARVDAAVERYLDRHLPGLVARLLDERGGDRER